MEEKTKESPGPVSRNLHIFSSTLKDSLSNIDDLQSLHRPLVVASNELVLELLSFKNYCTLSFSDMLKWVGAISGCNVTAINVGTFTSRVRAVDANPHREKGCLEGTINV